MLKIQITDHLTDKESVVILTTHENEPLPVALTPHELDYFKESTVKGINPVIINRLSCLIIIQIADVKKSEHEQKEKARITGYKINSILGDHKLESVAVAGLSGMTELLFALVEGIVLSNYRFTKYLSLPDENRNKLQSVSILSNGGDKEKLDELKAVLEAVYLVRDLVNEPVSFLTAEKFSEEIKRYAKQAGFSTDVLDKLQIESLKMGGLLAVNKGSKEPPTFNILEWKPAHPVNKKPVILVGKGIVFDTGGLSLKPTPDSMDHMKSDMAGGAAVLGTIFTSAKTGMPVHIIGLIPSTDNRPGENACAPGDIITMHNGMTVEVLNTDAEGRLILADALSFAKKYDPALVIDIATLTGAASAAIGKEGVVAMGTAGEKEFSALTESGFEVHERIVRFPFWDEYGEMIRSDIADLKNIGGKQAGTITAGKFLERFTSYPWIHIDIAGMAFLSSADNYRSKGATGVGVRLLFNFLKRQLTHPS